VPSGVSDQPVGGSETKQGALNRAMKSYEEYMAKHGSPPDFACGMEGGIDGMAEGETMVCFAVMCVYDGQRTGYARTATFDLPEQIGVLVRGGMEVLHAHLSVCWYWEQCWSASTPLLPLMPPLTLSPTPSPRRLQKLGDADDAVFKTVNSKQGAGTVSRFTCHTSHVAHHTSIYSRHTAPLSTSLPNNVPTKLTAAWYFRPSLIPLSLGHGTRWAP